MTANGRQNDRFVVLRFGWRYWLKKKLPSPIIAPRGSTLWQVVVHGHGFEGTLPDESTTIGFYVMVFVAAKTRAEAQDKAVSKIENYWGSAKPGRRCVGTPVFETAGAEEDKGRFRWRSRSGFVYYSQP